MSYSELALPTPHAKELWIAESSTKWKERYLEMQADNQTPAPSTIDCLADPSILSRLPRLFDHDLLQLSSLYGVSSMIHQYTEFHATFTITEGLATPECIVAGECQHRRLVQLLQGLRLDCEEGQGNDSPNAILISHFLSIHLYAQIDQMELVCGKEGKDEAQIAYQKVLKWSATQDARQAVWHAGQVLRSMRRLEHKHLTEFHVITSYQASLCLWIYGTLSETGRGNINGTVESSSSTTTNYSSSSSPFQLGEVLLDREESLSSQKWIAHGRGIPMISTAFSTGKQKVRLSETDLVMRTVLKDTLDRFSGGDAPPILVDSFRYLMNSLSKVQRHE